MSITNQEIHFIMEGIFSNNLPRKLSNTLASRVIQFHSCDVIISDFNDIIWFLGKDYDFCYPLIKEWVIFHE